MRGCKILILVCMLAFGCASVPYEETREPSGEPSRRAWEESVPPPHEPASFDEPIAELLAQSETDSCSICAREARERAFAVAAEMFPPGTRVTSEGNERFWLLPGEPNTLSLGPSPPVHPGIVFRFHTAGERLIGVNPADLTSDETAGSLLSGVPGTSFRGTLEVVPYVYGDGPTFLYQRAEGRIAVMCRLVKRLYWKRYSPKG